MSDYGGLITLLGQNDLAAAALAGPPLTFTHIAVGDGGGVEYDPVESQTVLANERGRYAVTSVAIQPDGRIVVSATVPANQGGWYIREAGIITSAGRLFLIANYPATFKPAAGSGGALDLTIVMVVDIGNAPPTAITITVQPSAKVAWSRHGRAPFIAVDGLVNVPPAGPAEGALVAVLATPAPTGVFAGQGGKLAEFIDGLWTFTTVVPTTLIRLPDGTFRERVVTGTSSTLWQVWLVDQAHTHTSAQITDFITGVTVVGDGRYLRKDASDAVSLAGAMTEFQNLRIGASATASQSRQKSWRQQGDAFDRLVEYVAAGSKFSAVFNGTTGAFVRNNLTISETGQLTADGSAAGFRANSLNNAGQFGNFSHYSACVRIGGTVQELLILNDNGTSRLIRRGAALVEIATEDRAFTGGTGILIDAATGVARNLSADRTVAFDTAWGDARYLNKTVTGRVLSMRHGGLATGGGLGNLPTLTSSNGLEICALTITPETAGGFLLFDTLLEVMSPGVPSTATTMFNVTWGLYVDGSTVAIAEGNAGGPEGSGTTVVGGVRIANTSTAPRTYRLRACAQFTSGFTVSVASGPRKNLTITEVI